MNWMILTAFTLPISYATSRHARDRTLLQQAVVVGLWAAYLSSLQQDPEAFYSQETMIQSVLVFILPLKLSQQILEYQGEDQDLPLWKDFLGFVGSFFYYALPISKSKDPPPTWTVLPRKNMETLLVVAAKIILLPVLDTCSRQLVALHPESYTIHDAVYWKLLALFSATVITGTFMMDLQCVLINLLSGGRYEMLSMHHYPLLSGSVAELWGNRYNRLIHALLKETIYVPLRKSNYSAAESSLAAFAVSGILHSWVAYHTFGGGVARASLFFVVQVPWILLERRFPPSLLRRLLTFVFFFGTAPLYVGLFVEGMPQWLEKNKPQIPQLFGLEDASQWCIEVLGVSAYAR